MTEDTQPMSDAPGPIEPARPPRNVILSRVLIGLGVALLVAVGITAVVLSQADDDDPEAAPADATAPADDTGAADTTVAQDDTDAPAPTPEATFRLVENDDGTVTLSGQIPSAAVAERLVAGAGDVYGADNVIDDVTVTSSEDEPEWLRELPRLIAALQRVDGAVVDVGFTTESTLLIAGTVQRQTDAEAVTRRIGDALSGFTVDNQLGVGSPETTDPGE